ncbi:MAG: epoxyqueuosine reductase QueH [Patescibacteria group bacterium]|nr:epoxyqueuosine reductase QueH [Patescibacteria group bacterium]
MDETKSKLLLHTCCGVCGAWVPEMLAVEYAVTIFYFNPNIYPTDEYERRRDAAKATAERLGIEFIEGEYDHNAWLEAVRGLETESEGGKRCAVCFDYRLGETARYSREHGFDFFATTLTIGRNKRADIINPIGEKRAGEYGVKFLAGDWKKAGGQEETRRRTAEHEIYRQNYCGCEFWKFV